MRVRFLFLFFLILSSFQLLHAQVVIRGKIKDAEKGVALEGVVISILKLDSITVVRYTFSNREGEFNIKLSPLEIPFLVKASLLGFASIILNPEPQKLRDLEIELSSQMTQLKEVIIRPPKISERHDTITYNVASFSNTQDKTIGDVLKKLPGIDVQDDGTVLYNGKAINKFYIDGLNLLENKYGLAVNNIAPKDIESVELLEGHQPIKALKSTTPTDRAALNLILKNSSKARWLGHTEVAGGLTPALWKVDALALKISGKAQSLDLFQSNNTGENITDQLKPHTLEDYLNGQDNQFEQNNIFRVKPDAAPIDNGRSFFNKTFLASTNNLSLLKNDYQLRTSFSYVNDALNYTKYSAITYYNPLSVEQNVIENDVALSKQNRTNIDITLNKNTNRFYLNNKLTGQLFWDNTTVETTGSNVNTQKSTEPYHFIEDDFNFVHVYGKLILKLNSFNQLNFQPEDLSFTTNSVVVPVFETAGHRDVLSHTNISLAETFRNWTMEYRSGFKATLQTLKSSIQVNGNILPVTDSLKNDLSWKSLDYYNTVSTQFINDKLNFKLDLPVNVYHTSLQSRINSTTHADNYFYLNPDLTLNYKIATLWSVNIHGELITRPLGIESLNEGYLYRNYRNIALGSNITSIERRQNYSFAINYRSPLKALFTSLSALYSPTIDNQLTERSFINYLTLETLVPVSNEKSFWNISGRISKGLDDIKSVTSLFVTYQDITGPLLQSRNLLKSETRSLQFSPKFTMSLRKWLNLDYSGSFMINKLTISGNEPTEPLSNISQKITAGFVFNKKLNLKFGFNHLYNQLTSNQSLSAFFADLGLQYITKKNIELNLSLKNIFNKRLIGYNTFETASYSSSVYLIRPFNALAGIKFNW